MITQIYSIQTIEEAQACLDAGVDYIGIASGTNANLPAEISLEQGKKIFDYIGNKCGKVALTVADSAEPILRIIEALMPDVVHVCGNNYMVDKQFCEAARKIKADIKVLQAVGIVGKEAVDAAIEFSKFCDTIILDSVDPSINGIGAAGFVNDWNLCQEIVAKAHCNVILAGGLGAENVADAIAQVRPWGVDSLTKTNKSGKMEKDPDKIKAFVMNAKAKATELGL